MRIFLTFIFILLTMDAIFRSQNVVKPTNMQYNRPRFEGIQIRDEAPILPGKIDPNAVDQNLRGIYEEYNTNIDLLNERARQAANQARQAQGIAQQAYDVSAGEAERGFTSSLDAIRQANQDAQLANRLRARAIGGAPSSGFLDVANRADVQAQKDIAVAGRGLSTAYSQAALKAQETLANIQASLDNAINQILGDASLSLRQKDAAIREARSRAASMSQFAGLDFGPNVLGAGDSRAPAPEPDLVTVDTSVLPDLVAKLQEAQNYLANPNPLATPAQLATVRDFVNKLQDAINQQGYKEYQSGGGQKTYGQFMGKQSPNEIGGGSIGGF